MHHVVIAGTGRAGTTLLVEILTRLGEDTGYKIDELSKHIDPFSRGGLEQDLWAEDPPHIVKSPVFSWALEAALDAGRKVEHIIIPIRDIGAVMESRKRVLREAKWYWRLLHLVKPTRPIGGPQSGFDAKITLLCGVYCLLLVAAEHEIPVTLLHYPKMRDDAYYLASQLHQLFGHSPLAWYSAHSESVR